MSIIEIVDFAPIATVTSLSQREMVVLANLADDVSLAEVAKKLYVSRNTVKSQVRSMYRKIGVSDRSAALEWASARGLLAAA
jgi:DNA-binding CsgD family transcriptional regulator